MTRLHRFYTALVGVYLLIFLIGMAVLAAAHGLLDDSGTFSAVGILISAVGAPWIPLVAMLTWLRRHGAPGEPGPMVQRTGRTRAIGFLLGLGHFAALFGGVWLVYTVIAR